MRTPTRKNKAYVEDPDEIQEYRDRISRAVGELGPGRVWNTDETGWKDIRLSGKAVARKGVESVPVVVHGNDKTQITAVCTISKSGRKLAPIYILRGTTKRRLADFADAIGPNRATGSPRRAPPGKLDFPRRAAAGSTGERPQLVTTVLR
jgi:hypothetical protein